MANGAEASRLGVEQASDSRKSCYAVDSTVGRLCATLERDKRVRGVNKLGWVTPRLWIATVCAPKDRSYRSTASWPRTERRRDRMRLSVRASRPGNESFIDD